MRLRFTKLAERDIDAAVRASRRDFGEAQGRSYAALLRSALLLVGDEPDRPSSHPRLDLGDGVRALHTGVAAGRRGAARHIIYYGATSGEVLVLRVLHDAMEPVRRVADALRQDITRSSPRHRRR